MEYVATETAAPRRDSGDCFADKIIPCSGGYVVLLSEYEGGDFNLLRALADPLHGGHTLDYRLVSVLPEYSSKRESTTMDYKRAEPVAVCALPGNRVLGALRIDNYRVRMRMLLFAIDQFRM